MYYNCLVTLGGKIVDVDIEVIDSPLDYNILLDRSYTYAMSSSGLTCLKMVVMLLGMIITGRINKVDNG